MQTVTRNRVDWFRVLADLNMKGLSFTAIAERIDVPRSTLIGWKNLDAEPKHCDGQILLVLWLKVTGKPTDEIPMESSE